MEAKVIALTSNLEEALGHLPLVAKTFHRHLRTNYFSSDWCTNARPSTYIGYSIVASTCELIVNKYLLLALIAKHRETKSDVCRHT